jgi:hypothetical protein
MAGYTSGTFDPGQRILLFPFYFLDCDCLVVSGSGGCFKHLSQHSDRALCSAAFVLWRKAAEEDNLGSRLEADWACALAGCIENTELAMQ